MKLKEIYTKLKENYSSDKKKLDFQTGIWGYYIVRPLSFYFSTFFIKIKFTANMVSTLGLIILFVAFYCFVNQLFLIGACLINIWYLSDCIDGNIARYEKKAINKFGAIYDSLIGLIYYSFIYFVVGIGIYFEHHDIIYLILGSLTAIFVMLRRCFSLRINGLIKKTKLEVENKKINIQLFLRWVFELQEIILLILVISNKTRFWLYFVFLFNLFTACISIVLNLFILYKKDKNELFFNNK